MMTDEELLEQGSSLAPVYIDGLGAFRKINGVLRCIGWVIDSGPTLNLLISLAGAQDGNRAARAALDGKPDCGLKIWNGTKPAH